MNDRQILDHIYNHYIKNEHTDNSIDYVNKKIEMKMKNPMIGKTSITIEHDFAHDLARETNQEELFVLHVFNDDIITYKKTYWIFFKNSDGHFVQLTTSYSDDFLFINFEEDQKSSNMEKDKETLVLLYHQLLKIKGLHLKTITGHLATEYRGVYQVLKKEKKIV